jgi:hypothetical protein
VIRIPPQRGGGLEVIGAPTFKRGASVPELVAPSQGFDLVGIDVNRTPARYSGETVVVGAAERYEARCRDCHEPGLDAALVAALTRGSAPS